jgi:hypothetical protein
MLFFCTTSEIAIAFDDLALVSTDLTCGLDAVAGLARFALHLGETVFVLRGSRVTRMV